MNKFTEEKIKERDFESEIQEFLVRETTKYGREGQIWTNQALAKGLSRKLADLVSQALHDQAQEILDMEELKEEKFLKPTLENRDWIAEDSWNRNNRNSVKSQIKERITERYLK